MGNRGLSDGRSEEKAGQETAAVKADQHWVGEGWNMLLGRKVGAAP